MARRKKSSKTTVENVEIPVEPDFYEYKEPEIVEPIIKSYGAMYKDAGAGIVKFMKITAIRDAENICSVKVKSGKLGHKIKIDEKGPFDDFVAACAEADKLLKKAKEDGFKIK